LHPIGTYKPLIAAIVDIAPIAQITTRRVNVAPLVPAGYNWFILEKIEEMCWQNG